jgi:hypothetical protein
MRRRTYHLFLTGCLTCVCFCQNLQAQTTPGDSSSQQNAFSNALTLYKGSLNNQLPIYSGPEYNFYDPHIKGNAYFSDVNGFTQGAVLYDGAIYNNIPMLYDLNLDEVVVLLPNHISKLTLIKYRLKSFDFLEHHFVNINADTLISNTTIKSGIYDELYNGRSEILVKRVKSIQNNNGANTIETYFSASKDYYIKKNRVYVSFGSKGSLLDIFKDKKKELKQYIKANNINYRDNPEEAMVKIATYYDHLTN